jgi:hypothetical protein
MTLEFPGMPIGGEPVFKLAGLFYVNPVRKVERLQL